MTSTPETGATETPEDAATERGMRGHPIPEPEAGEAELPESAATPPSTEVPLDHAAVHAEQPVPEPTTPTMQELELALAALDEIAPAGTVGEAQGALAEGGALGQAHVVVIRHASLLGGYPDWSWTVLLSRGLEGGPTVLEVALLPGETSLLAPAWVPWSERLADYLAAKDTADAHGDDDDDDALESDLDADLDDDFDDDFDVDDEGDDEVDDDDGADDEPSDWTQGHASDDGRD